MFSILKQYKMCLAYLKMTFLLKNLIINVIVLLLMINRINITIYRRCLVGGIFMKKTVLCKKCGAEIYKGLKKCPQCGKKLKTSKGLILLVIIIFFLLFIYVTNSMKEAEAKKVKYTWPSTGIATLLPEPKSEYGTINSESEDYFSIEIYKVSSSDFNKYINQCKEKGFTIDYRASSTSYYADDENGNSLSINYFEDDEMSIRISAFKEEIEKENDTVKEDDIVNEEQNVNTDVSVTEPEDNSEDTKVQDEEVVIESNDMEFRAWVDAYEKFMNKYVDFMNKYNKSDGTDLTLIADYASMMSEYADYMEKAEDINENELTADDYKYYLDAQTRITKKLTEIQY